MDRREKAKRIEEINNKIKEDFSKVTMDELNELLRLWEDERYKVSDWVDKMIIETAILSIKGMIKVKKTMMELNKKKKEGD